MTLSEDEQRALAEYQRRLIEKHPQRLIRLVLFGSKARGDAGPESDVDVLVVLSDGHATPDGFYPLGLTDPVWREIIGDTFDLLMTYGVNISPTLVSEEEYHRRTPIVIRAEQEGMVLWTRPG